MEEFNWERNMSSFPWNNINNHYQQQHESNLIFDSQNIFLNRVQDLPKPGSTPAIILPSSFGSASQYWRQTINVLHEGKNVIPLTPTAPVTSLESLNHTTTSSYQNVNDVVSSNGFGSDTDDGVESSRSNKRSGSDPGQSTSSAIINFRQATESEETDSEVINQMKEMIYTAAAFRPVSFADVDVATEKPRRKNVRISNDPQTVAARKRRERVSEKIRVLQKLVPGGDKMDTASMLDEAANYMKFLRSQVRVLEQVTCGTSCNAYGTSQNVDSNVALGIPFSMQAPFLLPHQQQSCSTTLPPHQH